MIHSKKNYIPCFCSLVLILVLYKPGFARDISWEITPEMQLAASRQSSSPVIRTVKEFKFDQGTEGWHATHPAVELLHKKNISIKQNGIHVLGTEPSGWNFIRSPLIDITPDRKYRVKMKARVESIPQNNGPIYFKVEFVYPDKSKTNRITSPQMLQKKIKTWHTIETEFKAPKDCRKIWIALEKGTQKPVSIDLIITQFTIEEISEFTSAYQFQNSRLTGPITDQYKNVHPRIYFTADKLQNLREKVQTLEWKSIYRQLLQIAETGLRNDVPNYEKEVTLYKKNGGRGASEQLWQRQVGNMIPHLALAYLLTGYKPYLTETKHWIFTSLSYKTWGMGNKNNLDLAAGHQLTGIGLAYDWLYHEFTPTERLLIRDGLLERGSEMAQALAAGRIWWHDKLLQNHLWVNCAGLATAAFAICDESAQAKGWISLIHNKFLQILDILGTDGASHEGYGYWEYGIEYIMRYMEMADQLLGINLYQSNTNEHPWLKQAPLYALYLTLPRHAWTRQNCVFDFGDSKRRHWYGPSYQLRNLARRFPETAYAGTAQWLATLVEQKKVGVPQTGHYLNFAWYDPNIKEIPPDHLPTLHHFKDIGIVIARSNWTGNENILALKNGPPFGHSMANMSVDYGAGHVHPDAGHFMLFCNGSFYIKDDGYTYHKQTSAHNTILIDGKGQKGEGDTWFDIFDWHQDNRSPRILSVSTGKADTIVCDVTHAYPSDTGIEKFIRTFVFKPNNLVVKDSINTKTKSNIEWRFHTDQAIKKSDSIFFYTKSHQIEIKPANTEWINILINQSKNDSYLGFKTKSPCSKVELCLNFNF